jgi:hypothetical protein
LFHEDRQTDGRRGRQNETNRRFSEIVESAWKSWLRFLFKFTLSNAVIYGVYCYANSVIQTANKKFNFESLKLD